MDQQILIKVSYNNFKFKHSIQDNNITFQELKLILCNKVQASGQNIDPQVIYCADEDDYALGDNEVIKPFIKENSIIKLLVQEIKVEKKEIPKQIPDEQLQHQIELNARAQELQEQMSQLKLQQSDDPIEAIVVVFDTSGSMNGAFQTAPDGVVLSRFGAVNAIFSAFADKTLAFELNHIVKLVCFSSQINDRCEFINDFNKFINLVDGSKVGGGTKCYDSVFYAVGCLMEIKAKYPNITPRIIALTDGEDNESKNTPQQVANLVRKNQIILDSFVVGSSCQGLKNITHASGGRCYCPSEINQALKLFENETILSVKLRPKEQEPVDYNQEVDIQQYVNKPFDTEGLPVVKNENVNRSVVDVAKLVQQQQQQQQQYDQQQQQIDAKGGKAQNPQPSFGGGRNKRVMKELSEILNNPSDQFKVYPTSEDIGQWKVLLKGAQGSLYESGIFLVMVSMPNDYPFKPPSVRFETKIFHCNVNEGGRICLDILKDQWSPALTIAKIMQTLQSLMSNPNSDDALDSSIASLMKHEPQEFLLKVKESIKKYAQPTIDDLTSIIVGNNLSDSDPQYIEKKEELLKWR